MNIQAEVVLAILLIVINIPFAVFEWRFILFEMRILCPKTDGGDWISARSLGMLRACLFTTSLYYTWHALHPYRWIVTLTVHTSLLFLVVSTFLMIFGIIDRDDDDDED